MPHGQRPHDPELDVIGKIVSHIGDLAVRLRRLESLPVDNGYVELGDTELSAAAANFDFADISQDYKHLLLAISVRSLTAAAFDYPSIQLNGDTGANYESLRTSFWHNAQYGTVESLAATQLNVNEVPGDTGPAGEFGVATIMLLDYTNTLKNKNISGDGAFIRATGTGSIIKTGSAGTWQDTSAITRIVMANLSASNWAIGSRATLYGIGK